MGQLEARFCYVERRSHLSKAKGSAIAPLPKSLELGVLGSARLVMIYGGDRMVYPVFVNEAAYCDGFDGAGYADVLVAYSKDKTLIAFSSDQI
jgi:hypothetical protein